jgi:hypothetical protein
MLHRSAVCLSLLSIVFFVPQGFAQERTHDAERAETYTRVAIVDDGERRLTELPLDNERHVNWQTSDTRYNAIMNRIENIPGSCLSTDDADYAQAYTTKHPGIWDAVSEHWIATTKVCPSPSMDGIEFTGIDDHWNEILNSVSQDPQACITSDGRRYMESVIDAHPYVWFLVAKYNLSSRYCG